MTVVALRFWWVRREMDLRLWLLLQFLIIFQACAQKPYCPVVKDFEVEILNTTGLNVSWISQSALPDDMAVTVDSQNKIINDKNTEVTFSGLKAGDNYTVYIKSSNVNCTDPPIEIASTTDPSPVTNINVTRTTESLTVKWTPPKDVRAAEYSYTVTVTNQTGPANQPCRDSKNENCTVTGLEPGLNYSVIVQSLTPEGTISDPSTVSATTNPSPVIGVTVVTRTTNSLTMKWTAPEDIRTSLYSYTVTVTHQSRSVNQSCSDPINETCTVTGLEPGLNYSAIVQSRTPEDTISEPSTAVSATTNPSPVTGVTVVTGTDSMTVKWTPLKDNRVALYNYTVTVTDQTGSVNQSCTAPCTVTGLEPGLNYSVIVQSLTPENTISDPSTAVSATTNPSPVTDVTVVARTPGSLKVRWTPPEDVRKELYTYNITVTSENETLSYGVEPNEQNLFVENLRPGSWYNFSVWSVTPENTISKPVEKSEPTVPAHTREITCSQRSGYTITVTWEKPEGGSEGFNVSLNAKAHQNDISADTLRALFEDLYPGKTYTISVYTLFANLTSQKATKDCTTDPAPIIAGAVVGSLLGLALILLLLFFLTNRYRRKHVRPEFSNMKPLASVAPSSKPFPVAAYEDYYDKNHADSDFGFAEEYQMLSTVGTTQSKEEASLAENKEKNRYTNVLPYDTSLVNLSLLPNTANSNYINANYMVGYKSDREFIATQGPLPSTIGDFWRMVWEQNSEAIVMVTNCTELNRVKCEHYWPLDYTPCTYWDITVSVTSETILPEWTLRDFSIRKADVEETRTVRHFHFTAWPDHGVPNNTDLLIQFQRLLRGYLSERKRKGSTIVHCSAGVGRTGTLIALDYLLQQIQCEQCVDVYGIVHKMRMRRPLMVQTESQYIFLHQCMLDTVRSTEHIYQNQDNLIYENVSAINA